MWCPKSCGYSTEGHARTHNATSGQHPHRAVQLVDCCTLCVDMEYTRAIPDMCLRLGCGKQRTFYMDMVVSAVLCSCSTYETLLIRYDAHLVHAMVNS